MKSKFNGGLLGLIGINILSFLIQILTLFIGTPWAVAKKERWYAKHTIVDGRQVVFDGTGAQLFGNYIKWFLLTIITLGIYGLWIGLKIHSWVILHTHLGELVEEPVAEEPAK